MWQCYEVVCSRKGYHNCHNPVMMGGDGGGEDIFFLVSTKLNTRYSYSEKNTASFHLGSDFDAHPDASWRMEVSNCM